VAQILQRGEVKVRAAGPVATMLHPGLVSGAADGFLNRFAALAGQWSLQS